MTKQYNIPFPMDIRETDREKDLGKIYEIRDYCTQEMSQQNQKGLIQRVVDICHANGGGTVLVNEGKWSSGPVRLYDNICLRLHEGAEVVFSQTPEDYLPPVFTRWEGTECYNYSPFIYARGCSDVAIVGGGLLKGMGQSWWAWKAKQKAAAEELYWAGKNGVPVEQRVFGTREAALRPSFLQFIDCKNVTLRDFSIEEGPQWTIHPVYCENVVVKGVRVRTTGHNTDGLNPDSCKNVWIEGCRFSTGDDCIAVNSGINEDGWRVGRPSENIVIVDCDMDGGHGAVVIGSGMSGGVKNVYAADCRVKGTMQGIRIKSMRGRGGYVENVWFEDMVLENITGAAIQISMFYPYSTVLPENKVPPRIGNISIKNISGGGNHMALEIRGLEEESIKNVALENVRLSAEKSMTVENVEGIFMKNVSLEEGQV